MIATYMQNTNHIYFKDENLFEVKIFYVIQWSTSSLFKERLK